MIEEKFITIKEAHKITGLSIATIRRYIKKGYFDTQRMDKDTRPIFIDYYSIPTYLRERSKWDLQKRS